MSILDAVKRYLFNTVAFQNVRFGVVKTDVAFADAFAVVAAAGTTLLGATQLAAGYNRVTVNSSITNGVSLPWIGANNVAVVGTNIKVTNTSSFYLNVWANNVASQINTIAANSPYILAPGDSATFTLAIGASATGANVWQTSSTVSGGGLLQSPAAAAFAAPGYTAFPGTVMAPNIGASQANSVLLLPSIVANDLAVGTKVRVLQNAANTTAPYSINAGNGGLDTITGYVIARGGPTVVNKLNAGGVTIALTATAGDWVEFEVINALGNANSWKVTGVGTAIS